MYEMGSNPERDAPFFFSKPADAACNHNSKISYPTNTKNLHPEIEMVIAIGVKGKKIIKSEAHQSYFWLHSRSGFDP
jgi:2-keto-4-pentenoate hydratase/2-oxohepta-3-ene-1,7-dioic acid hydratase (catechol pathway)